MILEDDRDVKRLDEQPGKMHRARRLPITELNQNITCTLCKGYFIDATTITECLHSFCRSCIVKYLELNKYCPVCDVQIHKTKPLFNIRPDKILQDIVYKLVPKLFHNETQRRKEFYECHSEGKPSTWEQQGEISYQYILSPDESICLSLNYHCSNDRPRFLQCQAGMSVGHLQKLVRAKYDLTEVHHVEILHNQDALLSHLTLMDVAYIYIWRKKGPLELTYRIYKNTVKRMKLDTNQPTNQTVGKSIEPNSNSSNNNNNWKEVQLRISENGEISVTGIQDTAAEEKSEENVEVPGLKYVINSSSQNSVVSDSATLTINTILNMTPEIDTKSVESTAEVTNESKVTAKTSEKSNNPETLVGGDSARADVRKNTDDATSNESEVNVSNGCLISAVANENGNKQLTVETKKAVTSSTLPETPSCDTDASNDVRELSDSNEEPITLKSILGITTGTKTAMTNVVTAKSCTSSVENCEKSDKLDLKKCAKEVSSLKRKIQENNEGEPSKKQPKQTILNHTLGLQNLSNNHPLKKYSQLCRNIEAGSKGCRTTSESGVNISVMKPQVNISKTSTILAHHLLQSGPPTTTSKFTPGKVPPLSPPYVPKTTYNPVIQVPKIMSGLKSEPVHGKSVELKTPQALNSRAQVKTKPSSPMGYKTLRDPPKTWNPQLPRPNLPRSNTIVSDSKCPDLRSVRPPKFFKIRNNLPRYLGNPASGVKPMYQLHVSPEQERNESPSTKRERTEIRKHSIVKIDPKTLKPISERAPDTSNLSKPCESKSTAEQSDLKINTSSVPIFNPLKLQNSPKGDRRSPKSPHSPKNVSPPARRDKPNLNFTPSNPFVPNLSSPTLNPNQFLYTSGPPGFPSYDPRVMAAYHSLLYGGQRLSFLSPINLDLNQMKGFDLANSTGPKINVNQQSPTNKTQSAVSGTSKKSQPTVEINKHKLVKQAVSENEKNHSVSTSLPANQNTPYRSYNKKLKDSGKSDKSLKSAVEKLTQNKIKECAKLEAIVKKENEKLNKEDTNCKEQTGDDKESESKEPPVVEVESKNQTSNVPDLVKEDAAPKIEVTGGDSTTSDMTETLKQETKDVPKEDVKEPAQIDEAESEPSSKDEKENDPRDVNAKTKQKTDTNTTACENVLENCKLSKTISNNNTETPLVIVKKG